VNPPVSRSTGGFTPPARQSADGLVSRAAARYRLGRTCPPDAAQAVRSRAASSFAIPNPFLPPLTREGKCMSRCLPVLCVGLLWAGSVQASGFLIPTDSATPPLAMVSHHVEVSLVEQVSTTKVTQVFRNHTDRALEATYIFPVPKGASVNRFAMWVDGKEVKGELVEADKARQVYTDIVRRIQDPGLLEYVGNNLLKLRVFPVPAHGDQKLTLSFTAVGGCEGGLVEYTYPLKTDGKAAQVLEKFSLRATLKS